MYLKNRVYVKILLFFTVVVLFNGQAYSQYIFNVKSFSMGRTSVSNMYGTDAFNYNPANIQRHRANQKASFNMNILTGGGYMWHSGYLSKEFYDDYFINNDNRILNDAEKYDFIDKAHNSETSFMMTWNIFSFIYNTKKAGTFGISFDERVWGNFIANKDFLDLIFFGNQKNRTYDLAGTGFHTSWVRQINLTYANKFNSPNKKNFGDIYYGISVKPQFGLYYTESDNNNLSIYTSDSNKLFTNGSADIYYSGLITDPKEKFRLGMNPAGFGFGFDLGLGMKVKNFLGLGAFDFGLSVVDLGYISWSTNASKYFYNGGFVITDITDDEQLDSLINFLEGNKVANSFTRMLPLVVKFGFNYKLCLDDLTKPPKAGTEKLELISLSMEYIQGITNESGGSTNPMLALGTEINIGKFFSPRLGLTWGGREKFSVSAGFGFDFGPVSLDVGTYNISSIYNPTSSPKVSAGFAIKYRIY